MRRREKLFLFATNEIEGRDKVLVIRAEGLKGGGGEKYFGTFLGWMEIEEERGSNK